jgi:hypothetical protein
MAESADRWRYGIGVVALGLVVIVVCFTVAVSHYQEAADAGAALAAVTGTVGAIVGAYFGVQVGSDGRDKAEDKAERAVAAMTVEMHKSQALAGALAPEQAASVLRDFGSPASPGSPISPGSPASPGTSPPVG